MIRTLLQAKLHRVRVTQADLICAYSMHSAEELASYQPRLVLVDEHNRPRQQPLRSAG